MLQYASCLFRSKIKPTLLERRTAYMNDNQKASCLTKAYFIKSGLKKTLECQILKVEKQKFHSHN